MRVIEGGEVVSSGDGGGGTCHNDKPGQSREGMGEVGMTVGRVRGEAGGRVRLAIVASRVVCMGKWKQKEKMGVMERKEWGDTEEAGPATMTSRALNVGMTDGWA